jgi:hypothetical protein
VEFNRECSATIRPSISERVNDFDTSGIGI